jgi:two-component system chemotaxis response regulator CheV
VVIHSSLSGNANEDHIRKVKADGYVAKFELNELSSVIEEVLDRSMKKIDGPLISGQQHVQATAGKINSQRFQI